MSGMSISPPDCGSPDWTGASDQTGLGETPEDGGTVPPGGGFIPQAESSVIRAKIMGRIRFMGATPYILFLDAPGMLLFRRAHIYKKKCLWYNTPLTRREDYARKAQRNSSKV